MLCTHALQPPSVTQGPGSGREQVIDNIPLPLNRAHRCALIRERENGARIEHLLVMPVTPSRDSGPARCGRWAWWCSATGCFSLLIVACAAAGVAAGRLAAAVLQPACGAVSVLPPPRWDLPGHLRAFRWPVRAVVDDGAAAHCRVLSGGGHPTREHAELGAHRVLAPHQYPLR